MHNKVSADYFLGAYILTESESYIISRFHIQGILEFPKAVGRSIEIHDCIFEDISFQSCNIKTELKFKNCFFGNIDIQDSAFDSAMYFDGGTVSAFSIERSKFARVEVLLQNQEEVKVKIKLSNSSFKNLEISSRRTISESFDQIDQLDILMYSSSDSSNILIHNICINELKFYGTIDRNGSIKVNNVVSGKVRMVDFINDGSLKIFNLKALNNNSTCYIKDSYMGKAQFYKIKFIDFSELAISDSYLMEAVYIDIWWPVNISNCLRSERRESKASIKDTYRQLRYAMNKQGDYIAEGVFYTKEMNVYDESLTWRRDFSDKAIIKLSKHFGGYGLNWTVPLVSILAFNLVIFISLVAFFEYKGLKFVPLSRHDHNALLIGVGEYFKFINPLHKGDDLFSLGAFLDLIARIFSGYMIYNIIRATRRFIK